MYLQGVLNYTLSGAQMSLDAMTGVWKSITPIIGYSNPKFKSKVEMSMAPLWKLAAASGPFIKIAAFSGAAAVLINAYGSHSQHLKEQFQKQIFDTASRYHFIHTLAMLGLPLCKSPYLAGTFMISGIILFCGSCYYYAFTGDKRLNKVTPFGGICFTLGWLSMCI